MVFDIDKAVRIAQKSEITEHIIYSKLAKKVGGENGKILQQIADDELRHYGIFKTITKRDFKPDAFRIYLYYFSALIFGLTFALKLMENGEDSAQKLYAKIKNKYKKIAPVIKDEEKHEMKLLKMLSEEKIRYASSVVLGLNDALVELTGSIAGLSFALGKTNVVGLAGLIIGIAASLSMAASSYLSSKEEEANELDPLKSATYTGIAYIITVLLLVSPYFLFTNVLFALLSMLAIALGVIATYSYYMAVVKDESFVKRFGRMVIISLGVAGISYVIGGLLKTYLGIDV